MSLDLDKLQNEASRLEKQGGYNNDYLKNFVKMPEGNGSVVVRLLPPAPAGMFGREKGGPFYQLTRVHKVNERSIHCPKELVDGRWKGTCCICDYYNYLWKESETKAPDEQARMQAMARKIKPIERYYYNVIVRSELNPDTNEMEKNVGPKILSIGKTLHKMIIAAIVGSPELSEDPLGDVTHPVTGRDLKIIKKLKGAPGNQWPNYEGSKFLEESPLGDPDEVQKWSAELHDLATLRQVKPDEENKVELKKHLGLITDSATSFDPTEFQQNEETASVSTVDEESTETVQEQATETETQPEETAVTKPVAAATEEKAESKPAVDPDFLKEIQDLSS